MSFLTPLFLLGAAAIVVPIVIHLTNREKKEIVDFPSLMFLRKIPYKSVRRQRLRHFFLFALRCLALIFLALAFARPFFETPTTAAATPLGPREVVLVVDNSYSMGYEGRIERAKDEARSRIGSLGAEERASVIVFSDRAEILDEPTTDRARLGALIDGIELSSRTTRYGPAIELAKKIVDDSTLARAEVVLISDFQRAGWEGDEDAWLPAGTTLTPVDLGSEATRNLSVTGVILDRDFASGRERLRASARVTYKAPAETDAAASRIHVELDGRSVQSEPLELDPNSSTLVSFEPITLPAGISRGSVRIEADALPADDVYHFVIWPGQALSVLNVAREPGGRQSLYIERALAIGDRPSFQLESRSAPSVRAEDLGSREVVVLNDLPSVSESLAASLREFVEDGGGLVVVLGESSDANAYGRASELLPARPGSVVDRARDFGGTLSYLDYSSPIFEIFSAPHSGDFSSAKFFRYRKLAETVPRGVLARFDDGTPALVEHRLGKGRVLLWTSTLDTFWNDLARQPVFLPFLHQLVKHAAGYHEASSWHTVGEVAALDQYLEMIVEDASERTSDIVVSAPSSGRTLIPPEEERALLALEEQGFYELREAGGGRGPAASLASNLDLVESDLSTLDPEELVAAVTFRQSSGAGADGGASTPGDREGRQDYWWYLLFLAFALFAAETVLSNRLSRA